MKDWLKLSGLNEAKQNDALAAFAKKRHAGAKKIAKAAKEKGGVANSTYDHFEIKLPYYKEVVEGKFDSSKIKKEYEKSCAELHSYMKKIETIDQSKFQKLVGKIEVLGELLIADKQTKGK